MHLKNWRELDESFFTGDKMTNREIHTLDNLQNWLNNVEINILNKKYISMPKNINESIDFKKIWNEMFEQVKVLHGWNNFIKISDYTYKNI